MPAPRGHTRSAGACQRAGTGRTGGAGADRAQPADERAAGPGTGACRRTPSHAEPAAAGRQRRAGRGRQRARHPPEVLPHIFEPFYTTRKDGLGLGLSLCETLATGMAGQLSVSVVAPRGTRFCLHLPLAHA
nr:ATP-binding protein [Rhodoferax sp. BAB1]